MAISLMTLVASAPKLQIPKWTRAINIDRFGIYGYKKFQKQEAYNFYKQWISKNFPRFLIVEIQHANPYYDDSYAVNSANVGPYGDAIMYELLPEIEKKFRGIGQGWARFTYGGSTGGWEALAVQMFYPDEFNGCFAACPDPIDFRAYCLVDIYKDKMPIGMKVISKNFPGRLIEIIWVRSKTPCKKRIIMNWHWVLTHGQDSSGTFGKLFIPRKEMTVIQKEFSIKKQER